MKEHPNKMALCFPNHKDLSFGELQNMAASAAKEFHSCGLKAGDSVLLLENLSPRLYSTLIALISQGIAVVLVEPWMKIDRINSVIERIKPKAFVSGTIGKLWGLRLKSVRNIPKWITIGNLYKSSSSQKLESVSVDPDSPGIITFTSGTTGNPKGMVRRHQYLVDQHNILSKAQDNSELQGSDLCIFANFALSNLSSGRTSIIFPPKWKQKYFDYLNELDKSLKPESATVGTAFLRQITKNLDNDKLKSIHVGGALTDCAIFEEAFKKWPDSHFSHIYGSTEAEPVALSDAHEAVKLSREKNYFQTLFLGKPVEAISADIGENQLWISGVHVCPEYLYNDIENKKNKRKDENGKIWHRMGDRITTDKDGWWYTGRDSQSQEDFEIEQKVYSLIQSSAAFLDSNKNGDKILYCQQANRRRPLIKEKFPDLEVRDCTIVRDKRHRARIDRLRSRGK